MANTADELLEARQTSVASTLQTIVSETEQAPRSTGPHRLPSGQTLTVEGDENGSTVRIRSGKGQTVVSIRVTELGAELVFEDGLCLRSEGLLTVDANRVAIRGEEELRLESGGDVVIDAGQTLSSKAQVQEIRATLGDVSVKANDDVRLRGERIRLNC
ncbi:hypothetical protein [Fuerstiella marisgermanici]|uniref:DUF2345 domain-containing protein n=1 Tax=Fuerstiella marisgermanici TaxID=1891926 RepID=A0A1P8WJ22_9PLAN|nr:hypothetical protein [Fuerstiella marisgermanici]APZ94054.1 hypothetical protein Fuma_03675 [Fuerstiella marisgermanici]